MEHLPKSIVNLIDQFDKLPGIGPKTAKKFAFYMLKKNQAELNIFSQAISELKNNITLCQSCLTLADNKLCKICSDKNRDHSTLAVVADPLDLLAIEKSGDYTGIYFVLGGVIDQPNGIGPDQLNIQKLEEKIKANTINEIIIATNPDMEGETTALYLSKLLKKYNIKTSRLARGLPLGSDIEYADEITLSSALKNRNEI